MTGSNVSFSATKTVSMISDDAGSLPNGVPKALTRPTEHDNSHSLPDSLDSPDIDVDVDITMKTMNAIDTEEAISISSSFSESPLTLSLSPPLRDPSTSPTTPTGAPKSCLKKTQPVPIPTSPVSPSAAVVSTNSALLSPPAVQPGEAAALSRSLAGYLTPSPSPGLGLFPSSALRTGLFTPGPANQPGSPALSAGASLDQSLGGGYQHSLHVPLKFHLRFLHPSTPIPVLSFVAKRLLSPDRPHGHTGDWKPIWEGHGDLSTAGVGADAARGCEQKEDGSGKGKELDRKLEEMFDVARKSWNELEAKLPQGGRV